MNQHNHITVATGDQSPVYISTNQTQQNTYNEAEGRFVLALLGGIFALLTLPITGPILLGMYLWEKRQTNRGYING